MEQVERKTNEKNKIDKMPDRPLLPIIQSKDENEDASFKRYEFEIAKNIWDNIKLISGRKGLTASNAVLGAFSEIIKKWSSNEEFVLSITLMDRQDKEMNIVGDFTAVDLLTVRKQSGTFLEKIKELQKELLMDLEHLSFSGIEVLRELNRRKKSQTIFPVVYTSTIGTIDNREEYGYLYNEQIQIKHGLSRTPQVWITNLEEKENLNQNEKIISSIWKEILGIEYVNKKDNFYSVGGDSLLIAQVVTKMRKSIKQLENISWDQLMREVLENPTLEGMSNIISQKEHSIQKMQKTSMSKYIHKYNETENAPVKVISFFHAGTGRLIDYKHMVENLLDKDMSDTQLIGFTYGEYQQYMETPVESLVQDRANLYAETLLEFNVDRYTLVGYCVGGFLALETAKILLENGKKVKLIMIDSRLCQHTISNQLLMEYAYGLSMELDMDNTPYSIKPVMLKEALEKILNGENRNIKNSELTKLSDEYAELGEVFTNLLDMTHEERIKALFNSKKQHNFNGEESTISMLNLLYDIYEHTFNAMMRYRPEGIYSGDITYINATEGIVNFYPDTNVATTWEDMVLGEFKIVNIYANHASIVGAEHSKEILPYIE